MAFKGFWNLVLEFMTTRQLAGLDAWRIAAALGVVLVIYLARKYILGIVMGFLAQLSKRTAVEWDDKLFDALKPPIGATLQVLNVYAAVAILNLPRHPTDWVGITNKALTVALIVISAWALIRSVSLVTHFLSRLTARTQSPLDDRLVPFVGRVLRVAIVIIAGLMVLQESGVQIAGILAGLGIGGLAVALAAKDTLANVFGTITIVADYPFDVGDWIKTKDVEGTVEDIGFRSTKVRTFGNSLVAVPNATLAGSAIENFSRMFKRRISFRVGVTYETTPEQMREAVARVRDVLRNHDDIRQDFWLVYFTDFAASAMEIMIYCFSKTTVWAEFLAVRESLNLQVMQALEEIGVEFAFPSQAVYMRADDADERTRHSERCAAMLAERQKRAEEESAGEDLDEAARRGASDA
jgi:MscS family membrane protein